MPQVNPFNANHSPLNVLDLLSALTILIYYTYGGLKLSRLKITCPVWGVKYRA